MKHTFFVSILVSTILVGTGIAKAALIVNTGTPSNVANNNYLFSSGQYFAGEFSVSQSFDITQVNGYLGNSGTGAATGNVTAELLGVNSGSAHMPGSLLFSASFSLAASSPLNWYGVSGLNWSIGPGTYWLAFVPDANINGNMPGVAPSPMAHYDVGNFGAWLDYGSQFDPVDVGMQIDATPATSVPEPSSLVLLGSGLLGLAFFRWNRKREAS